MSGYFAFTQKAAYHARDEAIKKFNLTEDDLPYFRTLHSLAFRKLGLKSKDRVSLIFHNSPEFLALYFSALCFGLTVVPINPDIAPKEMGYIINDSKSKAIFYSNVLESKIKNIKNLDDVKLKKITSINDQEFSLKNDDSFEENEISVHDTAVIIYTSGTTGNPKGVILSHLNLMSDSKSISEWFHFDTKTRTLCILPLYHNNGQITTLLAPLYQGGSTVIVQGKVSLLSFWDLVNRYDVTWTSVMASILSILLSISKERKDQTLKAILCGGQILTRTIQKQFEDRFEVPIFEGYGLTETSPVMTVGHPEFFKYGTVGKPIPGVEVKIAEDGEILCRGHNVMKGYYKEPEATAEAIDKDGWFYSGDIGMFDEDGLLKITDRKKSLIVTSGGKNVAPQPMEVTLTSNKYVEQCLAIGDDRNFISALVVPSRDNLIAWAEKNGMESMDYESLCADQKTYDMYNSIVEEAMTKFSRYESVRKITLIPQEWTVEAGELTPKLSIKRKVVTEKHQAEIDQMYTGKKEVLEGELGG